MTPTEQLKNEHRAIERMMKILENVSIRIEAGEKVETNDLAEMVGFIRTFADSCHHGKEEGMLFLELEKTGMPKDQGPLAVMLEEHEIGRNYVAKMKESAEKYQSDIGAGKDFTQAARQYIELLSDHIQKEDNILYPMADERLSQSTQDQLIKEFDRFEKEKIGAGKHDELHKLLDYLENKYL